jgi:hypothetical protein
MSLRQLRARLDRLAAQFPEGDEESIARARQQYLYRILLVKGLHSHTKEWDDLWRRFQGREMAERMAEGYKEYEERAKADENPGCDSRRRQPLLRGQGLRLTQATVPVKSAGKRLLGFRGSSRRGKLLLLG